jgi:alkylation response protein AidB-like acyl-CoA dehydrogenase
MTQYRAPLRDIQFLLHDVFAASKTWSELPFFADTVDADIASAVLEEGARLSSQVFAPLNHSGDEEGASWRDGQVTTPNGFKQAYQTYAEGGWVGIAGNPTFGGQGMPKMLTVHLDEMLYAANCSFALYPALSSGACLALDAHGDEVLKQRYLPAMYSGRWSGTMCLTESQAGSDLGLIRTLAQPNVDGSYAVRGSKIFITGGEHDLTENIIHLVLARTPDAPSGAKGLSLFLVPKILVNDDGSLGVPNAMSCGSIEHKMGIKASATCVLNFDGARGWLIGSPHQGLSAMFTMMNYERLSIGIQGIGCAEASYQNAAAYARDRLQGRALGTDSPMPGASIISHPDVRRMLLSMRAMTEGGRALATYIGQQLDIAKHGVDPDHRRVANKKVALLTPIAKAFFTDTGLDSTVLGQQVLGGHGYVREWGQEQLVRDVRIAQIYEGTNGIQALDLVGRKVVADGGEALSAYIAEILLHASGPGVEHASALREAAVLLKDDLDWVLERCSRDPREIGACAVEFLQLVGYVTYAWLWSRMTTIAGEHLAEDSQFYKAKLATGDFFFRRLLPRIKGLSASLRGGAEPLHGLLDEQF